MQVANTLDYLDGSWALTRTITDSRSEQRYVFEGRGELQRRKGRARYQEHGVLSCGAHMGSAQRALDLIPIEGGAVSVRFLDGRHFFDLGLTSGICNAAHPCRLDRYELAFRVVSSDLLLEQWRVVGPSKSYTAETTWHRRRE